MAEDDAVVPGLRPFRGPMSWRFADGAEPVYLGEAEITGGAMFPVAELGRRTARLWWVPGRVEKREEAPGESDMPGAGLRPEV